MQCLFYSWWLSLRRPWFACNLGTFSHIRPSECTVTLLPWAFLLIWEHGEENPHLHMSNQEFRLKPGHSGIRTSNPIMAIRSPGMLNQRSLVYIKYNIGILFLLLPKPIADSRIADSKPISNFMTSESSIQHRQHLISTILISRRKRW